MTTQPADEATTDLAAVRHRLVAGFRHRLGLAGNPAAATKWWADDLADLAMQEFASYVRQQRAAALDETAAMIESEGRWLDGAYICRLRAEAERRGEPA